MRGSADPPILKLPYRGAPQTVGAIMRGVVASQQHYPTRLLVESVCRGLRSKDWISENLAWYNFVDGHSRYMRDPRTIELVKAPYVLVEEILAGGKPSIDCDDYTAFLLAGFALQGAECRAVIVAFQHLFYGGERQYSHVFAQAREPRSGVWVTYDPVAGQGTAAMLKRVVAARTFLLA